MNQVLDAIANSWLGTYLQGAAPWMWPLLEMFHFGGLCILFGGVLVMDLRLLGFQPRLSVAAIERLMPLVLVGFVINLVTGALFFVTDPHGFYFNPVFRWKMLLIVLAGINVLVYRVLVAPKVQALPAGGGTTAGAACVGLASLLLWIGVIGLGRFMAFY